MAACVPCVLIYIIGAVAKVRSYARGIGSDCVCGGRSTIAFDCCTRAQRGNDDVVAAAPLGFGTTQQYGPVRFCRRRFWLSRAQQPEKLRFLPSIPVIRHRTHEDYPTRWPWLGADIRRSMRVLLLVRYPQKVQPRRKLKIQSKINKQNNENS